MINALLIAHSNWSIFIGERGSILFASEQLFLLILGFSFLSEEIELKAFNQYFFQ